MATVNFYYSLNDREEAKEISKILCLPCDIYGFYVEIEYRYIPGWTGSYWEPPEYEDIELLSILIPEVEGSEGCFYITEKQSNLIDNLVDYEVIEEACFRHHSFEEQEWL